MSEQFDLFDNTIDTPPESAENLDDLSYSQLLAKFSTHTNGKSGIGIPKEEIKRILRLTDPDEINDALREASRQLDEGLHWSQK